MSTFNEKYVSIPCPEGKPGCTVNHTIPREEYDRRRAAQKDVSAEWTRQYEKGIEDGEQRMLERIIKLLDTLRCKDNGVAHDCSDELGYVTVDQLQALIRGENK